ncbi:Transcription termination factor mitochondrial/chloroplastic [Arabidopsis suecica]|uniref:Transcription termination factor mitochondrial/chloroplastic n=1 Tax=Arabidopsis suecica TaxID=45249 RepID=A0A8T2BQD6_ARASU|nr:Transcription termination factor mitochondrial/chloroplastic [Arabidopsis suecica]
MYSLVLHGRRLVQLQKWPNFRVSVQTASALSNLFSFTSVADVSLRDGLKGYNFTVSYLVDSLGFTTKLAESISSKVCFEDKSNPDSKSIAPKLQSLQSRGASSSELTEIVSTVPKILGKRGNKSVTVYYDFVKDIIEADKSSSYEKLCHSFPQGNKENKIRNISVLRELGVAQRLLFPLLISDSQPVCGKERFEESLKKVVEMGFDPETSKFVEALRVIYRMSDKTIEEKVNVYKRLGFGVADVWGIFMKWPSFLSYSEKKITHTFETLMRCGLLKHEVLSLIKKHPKCICSSEQKIVNSIETFLGLGFSRDEFAMMIKRYPQCIDYTAETVKKKTDFIVRKMNWPLEGLVLIPQIFGYSLEKRTVPRCNVIKTLMSKGLLGSETPPMSSVLTSTDQSFLRRYVMKHDKLVPELMAIFTGENGK